MRLFFGWLLQPQPIRVGTANGTPNTIGHSDRDVGCQIPFLPRTGRKGTGQTGGDVTGHMRKPIIAALVMPMLLAGCATPSVEHAGPMAHHGDGHMAPTTAQVVAQTSLRREAIKATEIAYGAALVATTLALADKRIKGQDLDSLTNAEARASDAIGHFRTLANAGQDEFIASLFYVNFSNNELLKLAEGKRDD